MAASHRILIRTLHRVYNQYGPKQIVKKGFETVPPEKFAKMTKKEVDQWDFPDRHLMHEIARALFP